MWEVASCPTKDAKRVEEWLHQEPDKFPLRVKRNTNSICGNIA